MITRLPDAGAAGEEACPLFPDASRCTPWVAFDALTLAPGATLDGARPGAETGYLVVDGAVALAQGGDRVEAEAPAAARCRAGDDHRLTAGPSGARLVRIAVDGATAGGALQADAFDRARLPWRDAIHGGGGRIGTRHLWRPEDFASSWTFVDHAVLSRDSSLGKHYHDHLEEAFVVLSGRGWMTIGDDTTELGPGDVTWHPEGVEHGLYNPFEDDLDFVRIAVAVPGESFTTIDLDDDLVGRRPAPETRP